MCCRPQTASPPPAQAIGARALNPEGIRNLLEGRFIDALQSVAAAETMDKLHEKRGEFVRHVADQLRDNLGQNGMLLDSVSLTRLDQAPFASLDENNAFNAVGMRQAGRDHRHQQEAAHADRGRGGDRGAPDAARSDQAAAACCSSRKSRPSSSSGSKSRRPRPASDAEAAKAREDAMVASENARIERERETKAMELAKQRELRKLEIESKLNSEMHTVDSAIRLAAKHVEEAKAQAEAERARAEVVLAQEHVQTERERAMADRSREMALKRSWRKARSSGEGRDRGGRGHQARAGRVPSRAHPGRSRARCGCWPNRRGRRRGSRRRTPAATA